jgi:hypothetical protein
MFIAEFKSDDISFVNHLFQQFENPIMGCGPSKSDLAVVQETTGMTKKDAQESFKGFKKQAGCSKIKLKAFTKLVASLNTNTKGKMLKNTDLRHFV